MSSQPHVVFRPEDYLAIERQAEYKSEYVAGEIFAMAGASRQHNLIVANIIRTLGNQLLDRPCNVYPSDMRVKILPTGTYTYPDVMVTCGEERFEDERNDTLLNPRVIIAVLSESTEAYDRGKQFEHYQAIEHLAEYLLITQDRSRIEQYVRQDSQTWTYAEFHNMEDSVPLRTIGCQLAFKDVYAKVSIG